MSPHKIQLRAAKTNHATCGVPLCCMQNCAFRKCPETESTNYRNYELNDAKYLAQIDPYWAELLQAQQQSTAKYLYSFNIYGSAKDPTLKKRTPFSPDLIHQRLQHLPVVGGLKRKHMFLMLSIILNLSLARNHKQKDYMVALQSRGLLTQDILQYLKIIAHHPNTGLPEAARMNFQNLCNELLQNSLQHSMCDLNYFNPDHIFSKPLNAMMDPYELEYLRNILECKENLSGSQFMYLVTLVERLREVKIKKRNQYLKILHDKGILSSSKMSTLLRFLRNHNHTLQGKQLRKCFYALEDLMELGPCKPRPEEEDSEDEVEEIDMDKFMKAMIAAKAAKKANEVAAKRAAEEAARRAAEEAARKAAQEAARKKAEEAAREAARKAAEEKARQAAEEAARKAAEEAARKAAEEAARRAAAEAARKAAEEAARKAAEEAARRAAEEAERKAAKEAARKAAREKKLAEQAEKAALKAKEEPTKMANTAKQEEKPKLLEKTDGLCFNYFLQFPFLNSSNLIKSYFLQVVKRTRKLKAKRTKNPKVNERKL